MGGGAGAWRASPTAAYRSTCTTVGSLGGPGGTGAVANAAAREVYSFENPSTLHVVSLDTMLRTRSLSVGSHSTAVWLALYGEGGVAMVSEGKLRFLDAP